VRKSPTANLRPADWDARLLFGGEMPEIAVMAFVGRKLGAVLQVGNDRCRLGLLLSVKR
jgi:hypothetical protein